MDEIRYNDKTYVTIEALEPRSGYDREYLRKLAKAEKVDAIQIGITWLVNPDDLERYKGEYKSRGPREGWLRRNESAKAELAERMTRYGDAFKIHWFDSNTPDGFTLYVTCRSENYPKLVEEIEDMGLESNLIEARPGDGFMEYETVIDVPDFWEPPKRG